MHSDSDSTSILERQREQMLKLVTKSFYRELMNYGINQAQVLSVAAHLLDNVMQNGESQKDGISSTGHLFKISDVRDEWSTKKQLFLKNVGIRHIDMRVPSRLANWLQVPAIRESFYPRFPESEQELCRYLMAPTREYFGIWYEHELAGIIGAENIDVGPSKLEMRKLVGDAEMRGKGIGKQATFLFLYYTFILRSFNKVYIYSMDTNIRNLHLNAKFGFDLEGVLLEDAVVGGRRRDVVRMGLCKATWMKLFS